jgi:hypothetical protein
MKPSAARLRMIASATALVLAAGMVGSQAAGVAVLKEWSYHRDSTAKPVVYRHIIDSHGPYLRIVANKGNVDIFRSKMVDRIEVPDSIPASLKEEEDVSSLRESLAAMQAFSKRYPLSAPMLHPVVSALSAHLSLFDAGQIRHEGTWFTREALAAKIEIRLREAEIQRLRDVEQIAINESQQEIGLVRLNGQWVPGKQALERSPAARTELSDTLWPLLNPSVEGAKMALDQLATLAANQQGSVKVRTERLHLAIKNLFLAEVRYSRQIFAYAAAESKASSQDRHAEQYLKPNAFGTIRAEHARESKLSALEIRSKAANELEASRIGLLERLQDADLVCEDFYKLHEQRVSVILAKTVRAIAARQFPTGEFKPLFTGK